MTLFDAALCMIERDAENDHELPARDNFDSDDSDPLPCISVNGLKQTMIIPVFTAQNQSHFSSMPFRINFDHKQLQKSI
jgi:hypothetical protein